MKSAGRQAALLKHKTRDFLVRQRTQLVNTIRAHLSEFGPSGPWLGRNAPPERFMRAGPHPSSSVVAKGIHNVDRLLEAARDLPEAARPAVDMLANQLRETQEKIDDLTARIEAAQKADPLARRLATIPGIGAVTASAIAASCQRHASGVTPEVDNFRSARDYAAWLGLTPQPHSSGGKERLGRISKAGNRYWGHGAPAALPWRDGADQRRRYRRPGDDWRSPLCLHQWRTMAHRMLERKPVKVVAPPMSLGPLAFHWRPLANRMARVVRAFAIGLERMATRWLTPKRRKLPGQPGLTGHAGRFRPATRR